jgi:hypothetical protein
MDFTIRISEYVCYTIIVATVLVMAMKSRFGRKPN